MWLLLQISSLLVLICIFSISQIYSPSLAKLIWNSDMQCLDSTLLIYTPMPLVFENLKFWLVFLNIFGFSCRAKSLSTDLLSWTRKFNSRVETPRRLQQNVFMVHSLSHFLACNFKLAGEIGIPNSSIAILVIMISIIKFEK